MAGDESRLYSRPPERLDGFPRRIGFEDVADFLSDFFRQPDSCLFPSRFDAHENRSSFAGHSFRKFPIQVAISAALIGAEPDSALRAHGRISGDSLPDRQLA
jgi:hypothetical protein